MVRFQALPLQLRPAAPLRHGAGAHAALGLLQLLSGAVQVQVDPGLEAVDPTLAFRDFQELSGTFRNFQLLKLKYVKLLSNFGFNCNLRHYNSAAVARAEKEQGR